MSGKLKEILSSGCAPGLALGQAKDPASVLVKAPKALRELENEPRFKHGPARGASGIGKHFGMPVDFIKKTWARPFKESVAILFLLSLCLSVFAGDLSVSSPLTDGQTVHAADLNNLVNNATVNSSLISGKPINASPLQTDYIIEYSPTLNGLYKATLLAAVYNNPLSITLSSPGMPVYTNADLFQFYSASTTNKAVVTFSNLVQDIASNIFVGNIRFATTNIGSGTNIQSLANYPGTLSESVTNGQPYLLIWNGTNGIPYQLAWSNLDNALANDLGTNNLIPFTFNQIFSPWLVYTTNAFVNVWGYSNGPVAITNLYVSTNGSPILTPTLTNTDRIPIFANGQGSNTTVNLAALYQYFTNLNALPNYTQARIQFSGFPATISITNNGDTVNGLLQVATNSFPTNINPPYCVSVITNGTQLQIAQFQNNIPFWVVPTLTNSSWLKVFTNFFNAAAGTNAMPVLAAGSGTQSQFLYLTNYTSFNADAIQIITTPTTIRNAVYDIYFRNSSPTPFYYVSGSTLQNPSSGAGVYGSASGWIGMNIDNRITTNFVRVTTWEGNNTVADFGLVHALISPQ